MQFLDDTAPTLAENLAIEEALLEEAEASDEPRETLRLWEWPTTAVVLGRSSHWQAEAEVDRCEADQVPIVRRCSGGCAVVIGQGCLLYAVVLSYDLRPDLRSLDATHAFVMSRLALAISPRIDSLAMRGTCDLTWRNHKVSGNSLRCRRHHLLYHGTLLYDFDIEQAQRYLRTPPREPEYRAGRSHAQFLANLPIPGDVLRNAVRTAFGPTEPLTSLPLDRIQQLVKERYSRPEWHCER